MVSPKVFVSSTCYDLAVIRAELRSFIEAYGFEPIMSDYSEILYDYRDHVHISCVNEISNSDMVILIIGGRYGGTAVLKAIDLVDIQRIKEKGIDIDLNTDKQSLSVTQVEFLKSVDTGIPIFSFVSSDVMNDHRTWEKNKESEIADKIIYPSIDSQESAKFIFEFINRIRVLNAGNSIASFSNLDDIKIHLRKQWAGLFQRLLYEQRTKAPVNKEISNLSEQIADLKTAIVTSISDNELKETAKGAVRYRQLISFLSSIRGNDDNFPKLLEENVEWNIFLKTLGIEAIIEINNYQTGRNPGVLFVLKDNTFIRTRYSIQQVDEFGRLWNEFSDVNEVSKRAIIEGVLDNLNKSINLEYVSHSEDNYFEFISGLPIERDILEITIHFQTPEFVEKSMRHNKR